MPKLKLPTVTLVAAASVNVDATLAAMRACIDQIDFAACILFTDQPTGGALGEVRVVRVAPMRSAEDYSAFLLHKLVDHIRTDHCLVVQWDGFVVDTRQWNAQFLDCDYIGALWPQFDDHRVGNGGFSLRSKRLLEACRSPQFSANHPEDVSICRTNRPMLEREFGIRFADEALAPQFSVERYPSDTPSFGFHGIFNMIPLLGRERFWSIYRTLDDRRTVIPDYQLLARQLGTGADAFFRRLRLTVDWLAAKIS